MNRTFAFRQRAGHLNWKLISSVDIFRIVDDLRIDELQSVLDPVAFCEFTVSDVKRNTVDATTKLVHLMQLMIEYLLYCQESQLQLVKELDANNRALRRDLKICTKDNLAFREDIKIYKRQLSLLKQALDRGEFNERMSYRVVNPPVSAEHLKPILDPICQMIESVQRHEKETREYMKSTLDEQRAALQQQLAGLETRGKPIAINDDSEVWTSEEFQLALKKQRKELLSQIRMMEAELNEREASLKSREKNVLEAERLHNELQRSNSSKASIDEQMELMRKTENELNEKAARLRDRENDIKLAEQALKRREEKIAKEIADTANVPSADYWREKVSELTKKYEDCKGELYSANIRETRLNALLTAEREQNLIELARKNVREKQMAQNRNEIAVMTSLEYDRGELSVRDQPQEYRTLTWEDLARRNRFLSSITTVDDMMRQFEQKAQLHAQTGHVDESKIARELAEEIVQRAHLSDVQPSSPDQSK